MAQDKTKAEKPVDPPGTPQRRVLPSGLRLIVVERPEAALVGISLAIRTGSGDEDRTRSGTLHFIEHLVFKGTEEQKPGTFDQLVENLGSEVGARTLRDATFFEATVPLEGWQRLLEALGALTLRPAFRPADIESEKKVVEAEMALELADPFRSGTAAVTQALYAPGDPYGPPLFGEWPQVSKLTEDDLRAVHTACYRPDRMTLCVVGPVVAREVEALARQVFTGPERPPVARPLRQALVRPTSRDGVGLRAAADSVSGSRGTSTVVLGWSCPPAADVTTGAALALLAEILAQDDQGRLAGALVHRQELALKVRVEWVPQRCGGLFLIQATGLPRNAARLETAVLDELRRILEDGFVPAELEAGRRAWLGKLATEKASVESAAHRLVSFDALDTPGLEEELEKQLGLVQGDQLQTLLRTTLHPNLRSVALLGPLPLHMPQEGGKP
ncbi:M16 family metallopeptidase [Armatimonas rosea]|uniref:Putative Zn-dependent peptidase n=1 Tax=Armatimonas rosea TaxID=685828 RepID=A0A7W9SQ31_ARMRO|nr:pitrilysin family protein [Armatimonas rosea]MBB6050380.1 putative Zn-dependent peptidase [Armatimonas rosea]